MKIKKIIVTISIFIIIIFLFVVSIKTHNNNQAKDIEVIVSYSQTDRDECYFYNESVPNQVNFDKENYNLIKLKCNVVNNSNDKIIIYDFNTYKSEDFVIPTNSVELESPSTLVSKGNFDFEFYVYENKNLSQNEMKNILKDKISKLKLRVDKNDKTFYIPCKYIE